MPRSSSVSSSEIQDIVGQFVGQLAALVEQDALSRARDVILSAFSGSDGGSVALSSAPRRRGRPPGRRSEVVEQSVSGKRGPIPGRKRRKAPIQLCPVPGCANRAAPVFGMVCAKHQDLPKSEIKRYREARRAQRNPAKGAAKAARKTRKMSPNRISNKKSNKTAKPTKVRAKYGSKRSSKKTVSGRAEKSSGPRSSAPKAAPKTIAKPETTEV